VGVRPFSLGTNPSFSWLERGCTEVSLPAPRATSFQTDDYCWRAPLFFVAFPRFFSESKIPHYATLRTPPPRRRMGITTLHSSLRAPPSTRSTSPFPLSGDLLDAGFCRLKKNVLLLFSFQISFQLTVHLFRDIGYPSLPRQRVAFSLAPFPFGKLRGENCLFFLWVSKIFLPPQET